MTVLFATQHVATFLEYSRKVLCYCYGYFNKTINLNYMRTLIFVTALYEEQNHVVNMHCSSFVAETNYANISQC